MQTVSPETLGFSADRLARVRPAMQRYVDAGQLAGIQGLVSRRGQVAWFDSVGMADIAAARPMTEDAIFRIYSMSKPITSVALLMLLEEGRLQLSDPLARYIPAFAEVKVLACDAEGSPRTVPANRQITLHDLMTHTAGLSYGFGDDVLDQKYQREMWGALLQKPDADMAEWMEVIATMPLAFQPGARFRYSVATDVLGAVVQVVSGLPFEDFLAQRIFAPLGMTDTAFYVKPEMLDRLAACYRTDAEGKLEAFEPDGPTSYRTPPSAPSGGGGLVSTTGDYFRFCRMLLNRGELDGVRLLGRKTVEWMTTNHLPPGVYLDNNPAGGAGFGLGVLVVSDAGRRETLGTRGIYGWGGMATTNFWIDPVEEIIGILMLQFVPGEIYSVVDDFRNLAYQALVD